MRMPYTCCGMSCASSKNRYLAPRPSWLNPSPPAVARFIVLPFLSTSLVTFIFLNRSSRYSLRSIWLWSSDPTSSAWLWLGRTPSIFRLGVNIALWSMSNVSVVVLLILRAQNSWRYGCWHLRNCFWCSSSLYGLPSGALSMFSTKNTGSSRHFSMNASLSSYVTMFIYIYLFVLI